MTLSAKVGRIFIRAALILFGLAISVAMIEIGMRLPSQKSIAGAPPGLITVGNNQRLTISQYHVPNKEFTYFGVPGNIREFTVHSRWNSLGFNDKNYGFSKPKNSFRIVVLGDSYVEALQVPLQKSFHKLLEKSLNETKIPHTTFEVISMGASGNGARKNYEALRTIGIKFKPDLVLMEFLAGNDVRDDSVALQVLSRRQREKLKQASPRFYLPEIYESGSGLPNLLKHSKFYVFLSQCFLNIRFDYRRDSLPLRDQIPVDYFVRAANYDAYWVQGWKTTLESIQKANDLAHSQKSEFVLVSFDESFMLSAQGRVHFITQSVAMKKYSWDMDHPRRIIAKFCSENHIQTLDLLPGFTEDFGKRKISLHYVSDGHWNQNGHALAAALILHYLQQDKLIP
jgi:hypothetical protein